jgi:hypothetical protein
MHLEYWIEEINNVFAVTDHKILKAFTKKVAVTDYHLCT